MPDYPNNNVSGKTSKKPQREARERKNVQRVTKGRVIRKRKTTNAFADSLNETLGYVMSDVIIPSIKETIVDTVVQGTERIAWGESRTKRSAQKRSGGSYISYNRYSSDSKAGTQQRSKPIDISREKRARHDFDDIILKSRAEANDVIDSLFELISRYGSATVADLYDLVGIKANYTDDNWGWEDIRTATTRRIRQGFILDLPRPEFLD